MIVGSLALIVMAAAALVAGLVWDSNPLLVGSIVVSVVAAVVLFLSARRSADVAEPVHHHRGGSDGEPVERRRGGEERETSSHLSRTATRRADARAASGRSGLRGREVDDEASARHPAALPSTEARTSHLPPGDAGGDGGAVGPADDDPADEPPAQHISALDAARVARLDADVLVIDGRPRYHLPGCVHLLGRESEPLPVGEAVELGFSPCSLCEPDTTLLIGATKH